MIAADLVGALSRCADSLFNATTIPENSSSALEAASELARSAHAAVIDREPQALNDLRLASSKADRACHDDNLGLAHCLAWALETELGLGHGLAVGVIMPRVIRFNAPVAGGMMQRLAAALGVETQNDDPEQAAVGIEAAMFDLYDEIGFPRFFDSQAFDPELIPDMAMAAGRGRRGEGYLETPPTGQTLIPSRNKRRATIHEAGELLAQCFV